MSSSSRARSALLATILLSSPALSQPAPRPLGLAEALRLAGENVDVTAARNDAATARALLTTARQVPNPSLSVSVGKIPTDGTSAATELGNGFLDRSYDTIVAFTQPFEVAGKRRDRRASAEAAVGASDSRLADARRTVEAAALRAYVGAVVAGESARLLGESAASLETSADLARTREAAGEASSVERIQVELAAGRFRADAEAAATGAHQAVVALETLLGLAPEPGVSLTSGLDELQAALGRPAATDDGALDRRPDVAALRAVERQRQADAKLQKAFRVPDPALTVQYEREPPDRSNSIGLGIALPLPLWNRNAGSIRAAELAVEGARLDTRRAVEAARGELASTRAALEASEARARRFETELLPRARQARETVAFAYAEGGASLLELLEAERSATDVRLAAAAARADLVLARAAFLAARALPLVQEASR